MVLKQLRPLSVRPFTGSQDHRFNLPLAMPEQMRRGQLNDPADAPRPQVIMNYDEFHLRPILTPIDSCFKIVLTAPTTEN
jgi:hypothetical protein